MHAATIDLASLYDLAAGDCRGNAMCGSSADGRSYGRRAAAIAHSIDDLQGFYIWGKYEKSRLWRTLYLGKAGFGKTASLRARITEELKDERAFIWCGEHTGLSEAAVKSIWQRYYPPSSSNSAAENHINRALRKRGTTHIIWVATPDICNPDVTKIEADLIETLNPTANAQRPTPTSGLQDTTISVIRLFKNEMHRHR